MNPIEDLLEVIAKNQFTKDPYVAEMMLDSLHAVIKCYGYKKDNDLNNTLEVIRDNLSQSALSLILRTRTINLDVIDYLELKELHELKMTVIVRGKVEQDEKEKAELRKLYKKICQVMDKKMEAENGN